MIKEFFTRNIGMKAVSLLIAVFVWFYVVVTVTPQTEIRMRDIPIIVANHHEIADRNLVLLNEPTATIDVQLRGNRNVLAGLDNRNITAMIDLAGQTSAGDVDLPVTVIIAVSDVTLVSQSITVLPITIDSIETKTIPVVVEVLGTPAEGFEIGEPSLTVQSIVIEGPRLNLQLVDHALVRIDVSEATADVISTVDVGLYSSNHVNIDKEDIELSALQVTVQIEITPIAI